MTSINKVVLWQYRDRDVLPQGTVYYGHLLYEYKWRTGKTLDECRADVRRWTFNDWYKNGYITEPEKD